MRGLVLYGAKCTIDVWDAVKSRLSIYDVTFVEYPHDITGAARSVSDITDWVNDAYGNESYDFILGHSMGGTIGLELISEYKLSCDKMIFIDTNLKPAKEFYRNLLLPSNKEKYGDKIISMIKGEEKYYSSYLMNASVEDFDYTGYIRKISSKVYGIYGDRGQKGYAGRVSDLCLDDEITSKINFRFVENSCHMPMIENPGVLADIIDSILAE